MYWDWQNRHVRLSVGELSRFSLLAGSDATAGRWRAELGSHWHGVLREQAEATGESWIFERPVSGTLHQEGWSFELSGRVDQYRPGPGKPLLREVKTIAADLPAAAPGLRERYPQYLHQAMLYAFLLAEDQQLPHTEVVFLDIQSGITQPLALHDEDLEALRQHLQSVASVLEERRSHFSRLRRLSVPEPFSSWRDGQPEAREALAARMETRDPILFEAPTGFGKTGIVMEQALKALARGHCERILLLTGKNTGHAALLSQLSAFKEAMPELAIHAVRSRRDHSLALEQEESLSQAEILERWSASGLSAEGLLHDEILDLDRVRSLGQAHGIPPWALSRLLLPAADVWIADFNYLFDPAVCRVFEGLPTYAPEKTFLIIDEAHNLPGRVAASHSHGLSAEALDTVYTELQFARFPGQLARLVDHLHAVVKSQKPTDSLDPGDEADLIGIVRDLVEAATAGNFAPDDLSPETLDWLWNLPFLLRDWENPDLPVLLHSRRKGSVECDCLDAAALIQPVLQAFKGSVLMSATLRPWDAFHEAIGSPGCRHGRELLGESQWLHACFEVLIDARVDTRYRQREAFLDTTAHTIGQTALSSPGCSVAFFPSYRYAALVMERMPFLYPGLRCEVQPRDLPLEEQHAFLDTALLTGDVLFLILGSRFSEGIDALGGKVCRAIVVSPALPEVNGRQRALESRYRGSGQAFRSLYLIPGMRRISQALGRLVRSPGHRARILLHGKRFLDPDYTGLLPEYLQPSGSIQSEEDLARKWLAKE
ncbi:MAG: helicase C-terminal domain-containing protein [Oceanipulchritudo sp.]